MTPFTRTISSGAAGVLLFVVLAPISPAAQEAPPLPEVALDTFPPSAREAVSRVYDKAAADSRNDQAVGALGRVLQAWEQWDTAHAAYARAQALAPRVFDWHYLDAVVLQRMARHPEAAARLRTALPLAPDYLPARVKLAEALFESGAFDESRQRYAALAREPATEPMGQFGLGRLAAVDGRHEAAVAYFERAVALAPDWGAAHYALALSYRALGRREDARRALERHAKHGPQWPAPEDPVLAIVATLRNDSHAVLARGVKLAESGDLPGAIEAHEAALARDPTLTSAHANLISLYGRTGEWARVEEHYKAITAAGGDVGEAHYDYGVLLGMQQKWDQAEQAYRRAIAINPLHARAYNNLGETLERQGQPGDALEAYRRAVAVQPGFRLARFNVGRMLLTAGHADEAIDELRKVTEPRDAEAPRYLFGLAVAHLRAGQKEEGIEWATEARHLALEYGQTELAAAIQRDLARLK